MNDASHKRHDPMNQLRGRSDSTATMKDPFQDNKLIHHNRNLHRKGLPANMAHKDPVLLHDLAAKRQKMDSSFFVAGNRNVGSLPDGSSEAVARHLRDAPRWTMEE